VLKNRGAAKREWIEFVWGMGYGWEQQKNAATFGHGLSLNKGKATRQMDILCGARGK